MFGEGLALCGGLWHIIRGVRIGWAWQAPVCTVWDWLVASGAVAPALRMLREGVLAGPKGSSELHRDWRQGLKFGGRREFRFGICNDTLS